MSRCSICDCSQSADSLYHNSLAGKFTPDPNVKYSKAFGDFVCLDCQEAVMEQRNYWREVDGAAEQFNAYEQTFDASEYVGCTDKVEAD